MTEYISEEIEDLAFVKGGKEFHSATGEVLRLAPWSQASRLLWLNLSESTDHSDFMCCLLLWMLSELQREFETALKEKADLETGWFLAQSRMCQRCVNKQSSRGRVLEFMDRHAPKRDDLAKVCKLSLAIIEEGEKSEMEPQEESEGSTGKSLPPALPSKSSRSRKKRGGEDIRFPGEQS